MARANKVKLPRSTTPCGRRPTSAASRQRSASKNGSRSTTPQPPLWDAKAGSPPSSSRSAGGPRTRNRRCVGRCSTTAATAAVAEPGSRPRSASVYSWRHGFLWCQLPSGRCLAYGRPKIEDVEAPWADKTVEKAKRETKRSVTVHRRRQRRPSGGCASDLRRLAVQQRRAGLGPDILVNGMFNAEAAGYPIVLHTHDEMAAEVPRGFGSSRNSSASSTSLGRP
jgi:hypothetical protein